MEEQLFDAIHQYADRHWWFRGRKKIVLSLIERYCGRLQGRVLDLGCGTGNNLKALERYGEVWGGDPSPHALAFCRQRFRGRLDEVSLPDAVPYDDASFDLIVMLDVLEHIQDDAAAARRVWRLLKPGGYWVLSVPALRWLWSYHDVEHHHYRRYHRGGLRRLLTQSGFELPALSYANCLLLPVMGAARLLLRPRTWSARHLSSGTRAPARILEAIFSFERHLLRLGPLPIGGSLLAVCRRPAKTEPADPRA